MNKGQSKVREVVREYRKGLEELFEEQLVNVILYGSVARGEEQEESDVDILCVLRGPFDYAEAIRKSSDLTAKLSLANDVVLSRIFVSEEDLQTRNLPFFVNVRREGIPA
jgi:predicted nucleotidyltransferase